MNNKTELINQALNAAESSIRLARQLLASGEQGNGYKNPTKKLPEVVKKTEKENIEKEKPGIVGVFDGESMITDNGDKHPVPANYASKCMLVVGDTLKLVEEGGEKRFKQIEHVKRYRTTGMVTKKEGKFRVVTPEGSYKVLGASIEHFKASVGDEVVAFLPAGNLTASYIALESVTNKSAPQSSTVSESNNAQKEEEFKPKEKVVEDAKPVAKEPPKAVTAPKQAKPESKTSTPLPPKKAPEATLPTEKPIEIKMPDLVGDDELR